ncbi:hypothetical protein MNV49_007663 [Pseudohyphozyma bogoriensis]|nr:hypothetical protein MNV49_007663 [Pseudohyphozyma bogoriensis]
MRFPQITTEDNQAHVDAIENQFLDAWTECFTGNAAVSGQIDLPRGRGTCQYEFRKEGGHPMFYFVFRAPNQELLTKREMRAARDAYRMYTVTRLAETHPEVVARRFHYEDLGNLYHGQHQ